MAAATAAAPMKAPRTPEAAISSRRPERCLYLSWNRASPVNSLVLAGGQREIDGARFVVGRLGEDLDRPGREILAVGVPRAVAVHVERRAERRRLDLQARRDRLQLEEERLGLGDVDLDDPGLPLVVRLGHVDAVAAARHGKVVGRLSARHRLPEHPDARDLHRDVVRDGVDDERARPLVDALDPVARQPRELAVGHLGHVRLVVHAGVLQPAEQVLALGHHEHGRRTRFDLVGLGELDQRLLVLARIEQLDPGLVVLARIDGRVIRARGLSGPCEEDRHHHQTGAPRADHLSG